VTQAAHHVLVSERDALANTFALAFAEDPLFQWMCPDPIPRAEVLHRFFAPSVELSRLRGHAYATDDLRAGALWSPPEVELYDGPQVAGLAAFFTDVVGPRAELVSDGLGGLRDAHPAEPHFYLSVLGTHPDDQGRGRGGTVLAPVLERCDATGTLAYLESSNIRNVPFYERHGFRTVAEVAMPDGPIIRPMVREPLAPASN